MLKHWQEYTREKDVKVCRTEVIRGNCDDSELSTNALNFASFANPTIWRPSFLHSKLAKYNVFSPDEQNIYVRQTRQNNVVGILFCILVIPCQLDVEKLKQASQK